MHRALTLLGAALLVAAAVLIGAVFTLPALAGEPALLFVGALAVPSGLVLVLFGATRPDPSLSTVRGTFGNEEENLLARRMHQQQRRPVDPRYLPSPRESVNCAVCYTLIPAQEVLCPRCSNRRRCQNCGKPLFQLAGMVRCGPCAKDEVYCDCPRVSSGPTGTRGRPLARR